MKALKVCLLFSLVLASNFDSKAAVSQIGSFQILHLDPAITGARQRKLKVFSLTPGVKVTLHMLGAGSRRPPSQNCNGPVSQSATANHKGQVTFTANLPEQQGNYHFEIKAGGRCTRHSGGWFSLTTQDNWHGPNIRVVSHNPSTSLNPTFEVLRIPQWGDQIKIYRGPRCTGRVVATGTVKKGQGFGYRQDTLRLKAKIKRGGINWYTVEFTDTTKSSRKRCSNGPYTYELLSERNYKEDGSPRCDSPSQGVIKFLKKKGYCPNTPSTGSSVAQQGTGSIPFRGKLWSSGQRFAPQGCPSPHWGKVEERCLPSCGGAKGFYCRMEYGGSCPSNFKVTHCSKKGNKPYVILDSFQHRDRQTGESQCCLVAQ